MANYKYPNYKKKGYSKSAGLEQALKHIEEAEQLSKELGGTDEDVKQYFFKLPRSKLNPILDQYEKKYGRLKREYAEQTMNKWKTNRVKMSGLVASRLFNLLPPLMPPKDKYSLVEKLWKEYCPRSHKVVLIGPNAEEGKFIETIQSYLFTVVENYKIPEPLERRFNWLSGGDVDKKQELLNYFLQKDKELIVQGTKERIPVLLGHLRQHGSIIQKMNQKLEIGKHKLDLNFNNKASGVRLKDASTFRPIKDDSPSRPRVSSGSSDKDWIWNILVWVVIILFVYWISR